MYKSKLMTEDTEAFFNAILSLRTTEECCRFFEDVATIGEVQAMAQRLQVAKLLAQGLKYSDIARQTGASTATISRVSRCLGYGADGYKLVLERME
ncbi:MAG: helix-turn-helix domain-containing protein [Clostridia bacterium]|nr:helix-turn-helix domain-containing protein [Clostridia bacterium]